MLTLMNVDAGEYTCVLTGQVSAPMPQGPIKCPTGKGVAIDFKNPFNEPAEFMVRLDNPCFTTSAKPPIRADTKKPIPMQVTYKAVEGRSNTGRLIITAHDLPPWIYYLQGE